MLSILIVRRSPSSDRRKSNNGKSKNRNAIRRKAKLENYDADLSMDSLNSVVPLRIDKNGKINIEDRSEKVPSNTCNDKTGHAKQTETDTSNVWCGQEILSQLSSLKSVRNEQYHQRKKESLEKFDSCFCEIFFNLRLCFFSRDFC